MINSIAPPIGGLLSHLNLLLMSATIGAAAISAGAGIVTGKQIGRAHV